MLTVFFSFGIVVVLLMDSLGLFTHSLQGSCSHTTPTVVVNTLGPKSNGCHFADDIYKRIFLSENVWISIKISLMFILN